MAGKRRRRGRDGDGASDGPDFSYGTSEGIARNRCKLLDVLYGYYKEALVRLPLEEMPALAPRLVGAGICFGFSDPITNIIANTVCSFPAEEEGEGSCTVRGEAQPNGAKKRKGKVKRKCSEEVRIRGAVLSKIIAGAGDVPYLPRPAESRTVAERSLEGLITFLTSCFRYLPTKDALRYLRLANADLLVAVRLIEHDRCCRRKGAFSIRSNATKIALTCAALSARQPNIGAFLTGSFSLACRVDVVCLAVPAECRRLSIHDIRNLYGLLKLPFKIKGSQNPMHLAALRLHHTDTGASIEKVPLGLTESLRSVLLDKIHALYLEAISRLPMDDLRIRHHRGLLKAGYCYGRFSPVSNIILNTIWYDTMFPAQEEFEVDMICTETFIRVECRSLDGLVAFLRTCIPTISEHDAMLYLLKSNAKLCKAIAMAEQEGHDTSNWDFDAYKADAYKAAADAAWHPEPDAHVEFAMESLPVVRSAVKSLLQARRTLSSNEILCLSRLLSLSKSYPAKSLWPTVELTKEAFEKYSSCQEKFITDQSFVHGKVKAALQNYEQNEGHSYELPVICGVNESVGSRRSFRDFKRPYSHVNFWASRNVSDSAGTNLSLFFAEFCNDGEDKEDQQSICFPVLDLSTNVRCCYCEFEGIKIVHPACGSYHGGAMDFEKMALGEHIITNEQIISHGKLTASSVGMFGEDYIYFDPARDAKFVQAMNQTAWAENVSWDEIEKLEQLDVYCVGNMP